MKVLQLGKYYHAYEGCIGGSQAKFTTGINLAPICATPSILAGEKSLASLLPETYAASPVQPAPSIAA